MAPTAFNNVLFSGEPKQVDVTTQAGCTWSAASNATWVAISSPTNNTGSGRVELTVADNSSGARSGTLLIAGQTVTVNQQSRPACAYTISANSYNSSAEGGSVEVTVSTASGCEWTVTGSPAWVSANPNKLAGAGTTTLTVQTNIGAARSTTFRIAGRDFVVQQASAPCSVSGRRAHERGPLHTINQGDWRHYTITLLYNRDRECILDTDRFGPNHGQWRNRHPRRREHQPR